MFVFFILYSFFIGPDPSFASSKIKKIALGKSTTCLIDGDNKLKCWGGHSFRPEDYFSSNSVPENIDVFPSVLDIHIGLSFSCALSSLREVKCWGKIPSSTKEASLKETSPRLVKLPGPVKSMTGMVDTVCFLLTNGKVFCFGKNSWNNPLKHQGSDLPFEINLPQEAVELGSNPIHFSALLKDGSVWRWGNYTPHPKKLNLADTKSIMDGDSENCFVLTSGQVVCENRNEKFVTIKGLESNVLKGRTHESSGCAILDKGQVKCWGYNGDGKVGLSSDVVNTNEAHVVNGVENALEVDTNDGISCALLKDEKVKCWGGGFKIMGNGGESFLPPYELKISPK